MRRRKPTIATPRDRERERRRKKREIDQRKRRLISATVRIIG